VVVTATGQHTELGQIACSIEITGKQTTRLQPNGNLYDSGFLPDGPCPGSAIAAEFPVPDWAVF